MRSRGKGRGGDWDLDALIRQTGAKSLGINLEALGPPPPAPALPPDDGPDEAPSPRRSKYGNVRTEYAGVVYDSRAEAKRAEYLLTLEAAGALDWVLLQPPFRLGCPLNRYRADFLVSESGKVRAEDVKGDETRDFKRVRRWWREYGRMPLWIIRGGHIEILIPRRLPDGVEGQAPR